MKIRTLGILAVAALAATACKKDEANGGDSTATTADTSVVQGTDTVSQPVAVPTTDTVVSQTTTTTETDTVQGNATATGTTTAPATTDTTKKM